MGPLAQNQLYLVREVSYVYKGFRSLKIGLQENASSQNRLVRLTVPSLLNLNKLEWKTIQDIFLNDLMFSIA